MRARVPHRPFSLVFTAVLLLGLLVGCDANEADHRCEVYHTCDAVAELDLSLIEGRTRMPANVSILFKVNTEEGVPVANLGPENFDVFENEDLISSFESDQEILPKTGQFRYSIALLLDLSGSIVASENLEGLKEAAQQFVEAVMFPADDPRYGEVEMGVWWFDGQADISSLVPFTIDPETLIDGITHITKDITVDNSTNLYGAVVQGVAVTQKRMSATNNQDVTTAGSFVIFTDGTDQANRESKRNALDAVDDAGRDVSVYSIGLGGEIDEETLEAIGGDGFVSALNISELVPRFQEIANLVRDEANSYYLLEYCSPKRDGENDLTIKVTDGDYVGLLSTRFDAKDFSSGCVVSG